MAIADGTYVPSEPTGVYRIEVRAVNEINRQSVWSAPAFIYPSDAPPVGARTLSHLTSSQVPHIATAQLYGYQLNGNFTFVICDETIPSGVDLDAGEIEDAIETWETAVRKNSGSSLISTNKLIGPRHPDACDEPPKLISPFVSAGGNAVMFVDDDIMDKVLCTKIYQFSGVEPRGRWRSPTQFLTAWEQSLGILTELPSIVAGTVILRNAPVSNGVPSEWNAPGHDASCNLAEHVIATR